MTFKSLHVVFTTLDNYLIRSFQQLKRLTGHALDKWVSRILNEAGHILTLGIFSLNFWQYFWNARSSAWSTLLTSSSLFIVFWLTIRVLSAWCTTSTAAVCFGIIGIFTVITVFGITFAVSRLAFALIPSLASPSSDLPSAG
jgi:hypothetical protein